MIQYIVKNERGEYAEHVDVRTFGWTPKRRKRFHWYSKPKAWECARELGGKVYRLRKTSAKHERRRIVKFLRAQAETPVFRSCRVLLLAAATGIEDGEHWTIFRPAKAKESK